MLACNLHSFFQGIQTCSHRLRSSGECLFGCILEKVNHDLKTVRVIIGARKSICRGSYQRFHQLSGPLNPIGVTPQSGPGFYSKDGTLRKDHDDQGVETNVVTYTDVFSVLDSMLS